MDLGKNSNFFVTIFCILSVWEKVSGNSLSIEPQGNHPINIGKNLWLGCNIHGDVTNVGWWFISKKHKSSSEKQFLNDTIEGVEVSKEGRTLSLDITDVQLKWSGEFYCIGYIDHKNKSSQQFTESKSISITIPVNLKSTKKSQKFLEGEDAEVICQFTGDPQPRITWTKKKKKISTDSSHRIYHNKTNNNLVIGNINGKDEGKYRCKGIQQTQGESDQVKIDVIIYYPPRKVKISGPERIMEGENENLFCSFEAKPSGNITWYRYLDEKSGTRVKVGDEKNLNLSNFSWEESGNYQCDVINEYGEEKSQNFKLTIAVFPHITNTSENVACLEGEEFQISCEAVGHPLLQIYFTYNNGERVTSQSTKGVELSNNSGISWMTMTSCDRSHHGEYFCVAENQLGQNSTKKIQLDIFYKPETRTETIQACPDENIQLNCDVTSNPPVDKFIWKSEDNFTSDVTNQTNQILQFQLRRKERNISCEAINQHGSGKIQFQIIPPTRPAALQQLQIDEIGARGCRISFKYPKVKETKQADFKYQIYVTSLHNKTEQIFITEQPIYPVKGLRHNTSYNVTVVAMKCGNIISEETTQQFSTKALKKPEKLDMKENEECDFDFCINWESENEVDQIVLNYSKKGGNLEKTKTFKPDDEKRKADCFYFEDLEPNEDYEYRIIARNEVGSWTSQLLQFTSKKKVIPDDDVKGDDVTVDDGDDVAQQISYVPYIVIAAILIFVLIDLFCCITKQWGFFHFISSIICGRNSKEKDAESPEVQKNEEKQELTAEVDEKEKEEEKPEKEEEKEEKVEEKEVEEKVEEKAELVEEITE